MKKSHIITLLISCFLIFSFLCCEAMATLFHGPEPEEPPVVYTVTFNANGAGGSAPEAQTVVSGNTLYLPDKGNLSSTGNVFIGWSESLSGAGSVYSVGYTVTVTRDMTFYAKWLDSSTPQYTVTFNPNGAMGTPPASITVYSGITITLPSHGTLSLTNKNFAGWNTLANGQGNNYTTGSALTVTKDIDLYAKWLSIVIYTITFNPNGASGTAPSSITEDPGTIITMPGQGSMTYKGMIFSGWNTNADGTATSYLGGNSYTISSNATLYAQWKEEPVDPNAVVPPGNSVTEQLAYIRSTAGDGIVYDIVVNNNINMVPVSISTMGRNITVYIRSASRANIRTIQLTAKGHLFSVDTGITLILQNIVLQGHSTNDAALVAVGQGSLILNSGVKITGNMNTAGRNWYSAEGSGIFVNGGYLEVNDGAEITNNKHDYWSSGGGILVSNNGSAVIFGGLISGNGGSLTSGGGICIINNSTVNMFGGIISKNTSRDGGGVFIQKDTDCSFIKQPASGSSISGIIYGGSGGDANTGTGNAVYRNWGSLRSRNTTLGGYDEISSWSDVGWE